MNAYELAKLVETWVDDKPFPEQIWQTAYILRLQADEIEALRKQLNELQ